MILEDEAQRIRCVTEFEAPLVVEAAAGTGKTSLMACRVAMMLSSGIAASTIAAITFTDAAASELAKRIHSVVAELMAGRVPPELRAVLPDGLSAPQRAALVDAAGKLDELTCSTIHGFCQAIIADHAVDVGLDPGAKIGDEFVSEAMFDEAFSDWLVAALSSGHLADQCIVVLAEQDPIGVVGRLREFAELRNRYRSARPPGADTSLRPDIELVDAIDGFTRWVADHPQDRYTADLAAQFDELRVHFYGIFASPLDFRTLWQLAQPPRLNLMQRRTFAFRAYQRLVAWRKAVGDEGEQRNAEALAHYQAIERALAEVLGRLACEMIAQLSVSLQDALDRYGDLKRRAAVMDFDDLLEHARALLASNERARATVASRYQRILVDEFQDTDAVQAEILFTIASDGPVSNWREVAVRDGSLFLVADAKQSIYRFRSADIAIYNLARDIILRQTNGAVLEITANFRSRQPITAYVNSRFAAVFGTADQPRYVALAATVDGPTDPSIPVVAKLTIEEEDNSPAALRQAEALAVARLCEQLVGRFPVRRRDGSTSPATASDIALLAPGYTDLWRYERELEARHFSVASQAGKALMRRQEALDVLVLLRTLADPTDGLAFGALLRGPLIGLTDREIADIAVALQGTKDGAERRFNLFTSPAEIAQDYARSAVEALQHLHRRSREVPPSQILAEALESLGARLVMSARHGNKNARALANLDALVERGRRYSVSGLQAFVRDLQALWENEVPVQEGRSDSVEDAIQVVTMHSSKGLEWPIVIPVATVTQFRPAPQFVHRRSDATLHWVLGGLAPPTLEQARQDEDRLQARERERMWYVVCTRARDLLVLPHLTAADQKSWAKVVDLGFAGLPEIDTNMLPEEADGPAAPMPEPQSAELFAAERKHVAASSQIIEWVRPSLHEDDRAPIQLDETEFEGIVAPVTAPVGAGQMRGTILHKLLEEVLSGETSADRELLADRADLLLRQQVALANDAPPAVPEATEIARTALAALALDDVQRLLPYLAPEVTVWRADGDEYLAGRADALIWLNGVAIGVVDWKSDVSPTATARAKYAKQVDDYLEATGALAGAVVFMSTGEVMWRGDRAALFDAVGAPP